MSEEFENPDDIKGLLSLKAVQREGEATKLEKLTSKQELNSGLTCKEKELNMKEKEKENVQNAWNPFGKGERIKNLDKEIEKINEGITEIKKKIEERNVIEKKVKEIDDEITAYKKQLADINKKDRSPGQLWRMIDADENIFNEKTRAAYLKKLYDLDLSNILLQWHTDDKKNTTEKQTKYINLLLVGGSGAGKSSLLNTIKTSIRNNGEIAFGSADQKQSQASVTEKLILVPLRKEDNTVLPIQLFDTMGICSSFNHRDILKVVQGHLKANKKIAAESQTDDDCIAKPGLIHQMHGVIYVIKADTCLQKSDESDFVIKEINEVRGKLARQNLPQFVIVTAIDTIGVPNTEVENMLRYRCVENVCKRVSNDTQIPMKYIFPTSNYYSEVIQSQAKDAMTLFNLWKILNYTVDHLMNHENRSDVPKDFYVKE